MKQKIVKLVVVVTLSLSTFLCHAGDIPTAAKVLADALKDSVKSTHPLLEKSLATWQKTVQVHIDSRDVTKSAELLTQLASKLKIPAEFAEFLQQTRIRIDSADLQNPTMHLGESTQKALLQTVTELRQAFQAVKNLQIGLNPHTAALLQELSLKIDPSNLPDFKDLAIQHKAVITVQADTGFVISGIIAMTLASIITGLVANKHISEKDAEFTKADGVATCASAALFIGALALIKYSSTLAKSSLA